MWKNINNTTQTVEDRRIFDRKMVRTNLWQLTAVFFVLRDPQIHDYLFLFIAISFDWCRLLMLACRAIILIRFSSLYTSFIALPFFHRRQFLGAFVGEQFVGEYNESIISKVQFISFIMNPDII